MYAGDQSVGRWVMFGTCLVYLETNNAARASSQGCELVTADLKLFVLCQCHLLPAYRLASLDWKMGQ